MVTLQIHSLGMCLTLSYQQTFSHHLSLNSSPKSDRFLPRE